MLSRILIHSTIKSGNIARKVNKRDTDFVSTENLHTLIEPSKLLKQPRKNLTASAIQNFELRPKRALKINLE